MSSGWQYLYVLEEYGGPSEGHRVALCGNVQLMLCMQDMDAPNVSDAPSCKTAPLSLTLNMQSHQQGTPG